MHRLAYVEKQWKKVWKWRIVSLIRNSRKRIKCFYPIGTWLSMGSSGLSNIWLGKDDMGCCHSSPSINGPPTNRYFQLCPSLFLAQANDMGSFVGTQKEGTTTTVIEYWQTIYKNKKTRRALQIHIQFYELLTMNLVVHPFSQKKYLYVLGTSC